VSRTLFIQGGWYCDNRPGGAFVVLLPDRHLFTDRGIVPLPEGQNVLYVRMAPDGIRFAGAAQRTDRILEWDGSRWHDRGKAYGVSPCIYDNQGVLRINDGSWGSQGARYVEDDNSILTGDETYFEDTMELSEWSAISDFIFIGQSHPDGTNDAAWVWDAGTLRLLEPGPCRFIRATCEGEQAAIAIWKPGQGAALGWPTLSELRALPVVANTPIPVPVPPKPEPKPMSLPDPNAVKAAVERELAKYGGRRMTNDEMGLACNNAALQFADCGLHAKGPGENTATLPDGRTVNRNVIRFHPPTDPDFGWWSDVLIGAGTGFPKATAPDWKRGQDDRRSWVAPKRFDAPVPEPEPEPEPLPPPTFPRSHWSELARASEVDLQSQITLLTRRVERLETGR
jgi:hypothetical protein